MLQTIKDSPLSSDRSLFSAMAVEEPSEDSAISMTTHLNEDDKEAPADEELTSLSWLQDTNLLKNFQVGEYGLEEEEEEESSNDCLEEVEHIEEVTAHHEVEELENEDVGGGGQNVAPYHPTLHSHSKPPFSFSCLIFMAIEDCPRKALPVKEIYSWILQHFPYFHTAPTGWKNSVRHNLSLSKCFRKVEKEKGQNVGKGSLWCIDPEFRPNLLQALQKAPSMANLEFSHFFSSSPRKGDSSEIKPCLLVSSQEAIQIPSPELFPFLSRRLASSMKDPEVDAAATMLTLKNGHPLHSETEYKRTAVCEESENDSVQNVQKFVRKRLRLKPPSSVSKRSKKPVITSSPSEDHTYSACVEAGKQNGVTTLECNNNNVEEEGANALMNLAEIASKRLLRKVNNPSS